MNWQALFLSGQGRIGRRDFWIGFAGVMVASLVLQFIPVIGQLVGLVLLWPQVNINTKRLHDMGKSGWWLLAPLGVTILCAIAAVIFGGAAIFASGGGDGHRLAGGLTAFGIALVFLGVAGLTGLGFLLWIGVTPGQPLDNRFGSPPVAAALT